MHRNAEKNADSLISQIRRFLYSDFFAAFVVATAGLCFLFRVEFVGVICSVLLIIIVMIVSDDLLPSLLPFMSAMMQAFCIRGSLGSWNAFLPLLVPVVIAVVFHLIYYRRKLIIDSMFWPILAVSVAVTFGGTLSISMQSYFSWMNLYYVIGLGFAQLLLYVVFRSFINPDKTYDTKEYFVKIMIYLGLLCVIAVALQYARNAGAFIDTLAKYGFDDEFMQLGTERISDALGGNFSSVIIWTLPFPIYFIRKKQRPYLMFALMIVQYIALTCMFSGRSLAVGTVEIMICLVYLAVVGKGKLRISSIIFLCLSATVTAGVIIGKFDVVKPLIIIDSDDVRFYYLRHALDSFFNNPVFGKGLAYRIPGYAECYDNCIHWYYSTPFQVIASMGMVGVIAYSYQFVMRLYTMVNYKYRSEFNIVMLFAFVCFEMSAFMNNEDFLPLPFMLFMTLTIAATEIVNEEELCRRNLFDKSEEIVLSIDKTLKEKILKKKKNAE